LHPNQFGFRKNLSTAYAMLEIMNKVSNTMKNKQLIGLVCFDLEKAFDMVSPDVLIQKTRALWDTWNS